MGKRKKALTKAKTKTDEKIINRQRPAVSNWIEAEG